MTAAARKAAAELQRTLERSPGRHIGSDRPLARPIVLRLRWPGNIQAFHTLDDAADRLVDLRARKVAGVRAYGPDGAPAPAPTRRKLVRLAAKLEAAR